MIIYQCIQWVQRVYGRDGCGGGAAPGGEGDEDKGRSGGGKQEEGRRKGVSLGGKERSDF